MRTRPSAICGTVGVPRRHFWVKAIARDRWDGPSSYRRLCLDHYIDLKKSDKPESPSYIPSVYKKMDMLKGKNSPIKRKTQVEVMLVLPLLKESLSRGKKRQIDFAKDTLKEAVWGTYGHHDYIKTMNLSSADSYTEHLVHEMDNMRENFEKQSKRLKR